MTFGFEDSAESCLRGSDDAGGSGDDDVANAGGVLEPESGGNNGVVVVVLVLVLVEVVVVVVVVVVFEDFLRLRSPLDASASFPFPFASLRDGLAEITVDFFDFLVIAAVTAAPVDEGGGGGGGDGGEKRDAWFVTGEVVFSTKAEVAADKESEVTLSASEKDAGVGAPVVVAAAIAGSGGFTVDGGACMTTAGFVCNDDGDSGCFATKSTSSQELS